MSQDVYTFDVFPSTPENLFTLPSGKLTEFPIDALNCTLSRASAVLLLLSTDGADLNHGFTLNHQSVMDVLWCIEGLITQAKILVNCAHQEAKS